MGLGDELVELIVATDIQTLEPLEELREVADGAVPEHLGLAVFADTTNAIAQMGDELRELLKKG